VAGAPLERPPAWHKERELPMQAQPTAGQDQDGFYDEVVLRHVLTERPTIFRLCDLIRELAKDPDDLFHRDAVEVAVNELTRAGLLYREGKCVLPTPTAVYVQGMELQ
jgi:hypothetical protein